MSLLVIVIVYLASGCLAGCLAGLFGIGGGIVIVPVLTFVFGSFGFPPAILLKLAVGTSMAVVALTSILSARTHGRNGNVDVAHVRRFLPFVVAGVIVGAVAGANVSRTVLLVSVIAFEVVVAGQFLVQALMRRPETNGAVLGNATPGFPMLGGSIVLGGVSSMVGIAGGSLFVPFLSYGGLPMRRSIGTAAALGIPVGVVAAIVYLIVGMVGQRDLPTYSLGYVYLPAFAGCVLGSLLTVRSGVAIGKHMNTRQLKAAFAFILLIAAAKMGSTLLG